MSRTSFPAEWLKKFTDPYAVLGVPVTADDRRILKRYRLVAKILHPDSYNVADGSNRELASQIFARLISPAYQKLKQEQEKAQVLAMLRFQVRRISKQGPLQVTSENASRLLTMSPQEAEVFYEQIVAELIEGQYQPLEQFESLTHQLMELNQAYFYVKMGDLVIREKRTGIVSSVEAKPVQFTPISNFDTKESPAENYARRHYERAQEYVKREAFLQAVQELRDAIKLENDQSEYHSLLGLVYLKQNLTGMATVHFRQALKLNPQDPLAREYANKLNINLSVNQNESQPTEQPRRQGGFFGLFGVRK